ncbi:MAG: hypothetical protein N2512_03210 [Armatimonadetes bacterium]|nr:hypothetical protein [Armatimonadota bacterium]
MTAGACGQAPGADRPPSYVPFGVYLAWERVPALAEFNGLEKWDFVARLLDTLQANKVDSVWPVNILIPDLAPLLRLAAERQMRVFPGLAEIHYDIDWRHNNWDYYDAQLAAIKESLTAAGDAASALGGYVLCDEPRAAVIEGLEQLRQRFAAMDPTRPAFAVTQWPVTPAAIEKTRAPILCTDLYPFFAPGNQNGPHTPQASRAFYVNNLLRYSATLRDTDRVHWAMFQCFVEIWGPWEYDKAFRAVALPGSYVNWVCPTEAQMRWQVWAALRCGSKGFFCFLATPPAPDPATAEAKPPDIAAMGALPIPVTEQPTDTGPAALVNPDLTPTPQLQAMGQAYASIAPHQELILAWRPSDAVVAQVEAPCSLAIFERPASPAEYYAVLTNDDFDTEARTEIHFDASVRQVEDLVSGRALELTDRGFGAQTTVVLQAGAGTLLRLLTR